MLSKPRPPIEYVPAAIIRRLFNEGRFYERSKPGPRGGDLIRRRERVYRPDPLPEGEPRGTIGERYAYYRRSDGHLVAIVHQYRRPNGDLGASGLPDPKLLFVEGRWMAPFPEEPD